LYNRLLEEERYSVLGVTQRLKKKDNFFIMKNIIFSLASIITIIVLAIVTTTTIAYKPVVCPDEYLGSIYYPEGTVCGSAELNMDEEVIEDADNSDNDNDYNSEEATDDEKKAMKKNKK